MNFLCIYGVYRYIYCAPFNRTALHCPLCEIKYMILCWSCINVNINNVRVRCLCVVYCLLCVYGGLLNWRELRCAVYTRISTEHSWALRRMLYIMYIKNKKIQKKQKTKQKKQKKQKNKKTKKNKKPRRRAGTLPWWRGLRYSFSKINFGLFFEKEY